MVRPSRYRPIRLASVSCAGDNNASLLLLFSRAARLTAENGRRRSYEPTNLQALEDVRMIAGDAGSEVVSAIAINFQAYVVSLISLILSLTSTLVPRVEVTT